MSTDKAPRSQPDARQHLGPRELWRRYRGVAAVSLVLGAWVGFAVILLMGGNTSMLGHQFLLGASFGAATATIACIGGFAVLFYRAKQGPLDRSQRQNTGATGAAGAVLAVWLLFAGWASASEGSLVWFAFFIPIAIISGVITWVATYAGMTWAERFAVRANRGPDEQSL